jgi:nitrile hydratase subunit beta
MNGAHDMGGRMGFGSVQREADEPVFHAAWEARFFGLANAVGEVGGWTLDEDRHACENRLPAEYLRNSYYETWLKALEKLVVAKGILEPSELASGSVHRLSEKKIDQLKPEQVWKAVTSLGSYQRKTNAKPAFTIGATVRVRNLHVTGHTRLPGYLRGCTGKIVACHGAHVFPDSNAHGRGEDPRYLYTVRFRASDVFAAQTQDTIHADMWEPYLDAA